MKLFVFQVQKADSIVHTVLYSLLRRPYTTLQRPPHGAPQGLFAQ